MRALLIAVALLLIVGAIVAHPFRAAIVVTGSTNQAYNNTDPWATSGLIVGYTSSSPGSMTVSGGSSVSNIGDGKIALLSSTSTSTVIVTGAGSSWSNSANLLVGPSGSGVLEVTDGGTVSMAIAYIGYSFGSGAVTVTGGGTMSSSTGYIGQFTGSSGIVNVGGGAGASTWNNVNRLYVGYWGTGTLNITGGGTVSSSDVYIGYDPSAGGVVTVGGGSGTSTLAISSTLYLGDKGYEDENGSATLNINTGGLVSAAYLAADNAASNLNFDGGTLRITNGASTLSAISLLSGGGTFDVATPSTTFIIASDISGTGGLTKTGAGQVLFQVPNSYTGTTTISDGALEVSDLGSNKLPTNSFLSLDGGVLATRGTFTRSIAPSGAGKLQWTANGGGFAGYAGALTVNLGGAGAEQIWGDSLGTTIQGPLIFGVGAGGVLFQNPVDLNNSATTVDRTVTVRSSAEMSGALRNTGADASLTKNGVGTLILSGANTYTGATTVGAGTLSVSNIGTAGNSSNLGTNSTINLGATTTAATLKYTGVGETSDKVINLAGTTGGGIIDQSGTGLLKFTSNLTASGSGVKTLTLQGSTTGTGHIDGVIVDSAGGATAVTKLGTGTWTLAAANTYSGTTTISGGTLRVSDDRNFGAVPVSFTTGNIVLDGGGALQFGADFDISENRGITIGSAVGGGTIDTQGFTNPSGYNAPADGFSGGNSLTKTGSGTFFAAAATDDANDNWRGRLIIKEGTWKIVATDGLPSPWSSDIADLLTLDGGTLQIAADITSSSPRRGITVAAGGGTIDTQAYSLNWAGQLAASGTTRILTKVGSGILTLNSNRASTYSGIFNINGGTVVLNGGAAMGDSATLNLANTAGVALTVSDTETIGSLSGGGAAGGNVHVPSGLVTGGNNKTTSFGGMISGAGTLRKNGTGVMTLTGANSYNGATTIAAGTLSVSNIGTTGNSSNLGTNGTINLGATTVSGTLTYIGAGETSDKVINLAGTTGGGIIDQSGTGLLTFTSSLTPSGSGVKTLTLQGSTTGTGEIDGQIVDNSSTNKTSVTKTGTGTWTLAAANTYSGTTTISNGVLLLGNNSSLGASQLTMSAGTIASSGGERSIGNNTVLSGASFSIGGSASFTISGTFTNSGGNRTLNVNNTETTTLSGTVNLSSSSSSRILTIAGTGNTTITGNIVNGSTSTASALTKDGTGTLTLAGSNSYSGLTTVNAGTASIIGSITGGAVVNSGGTLNGTGAIGGTVTINSGGVFSPGTSAGTITVRALTLKSSSLLNFELGVAARDHIMLTNNGNVALGGTLNVSLLPGYTPTIGQTFPLFEGSVGAVTGAFASYAPPVVNDLMIDLRQIGGSLVLQVVDATLPGDFNNDGAVDARDYVVWRKGLGNPYTQTHYNTWRGQFGQPGGSGTGTNANAAIPEPSTVVLLLIGLLTINCRRRMGVS